MERRFALVLLASVVFIGPRVICQHDARSPSGIIQVHLVLLGEADMFVSVEVFHCLIEHRTQAIGILRLHWASPMVSLLHCAWAELIATCFALLVLPLAMVVCLSLA